MKTTFAVASFVAAVLAQAPSISDLIASQPDLSILGTALGLVPELAEVLGGLSGVTILAPTDSAFEALLGGNTTQEAFSISQQDAAAVARILSYHVLNGTYTSSDFSETPAFAQTLLTPSSDEPFVSNVTGGQNVGLVLDGENATILSGELQSANVVQAVCCIVPRVFHLLTVTGHRSRKQRHCPQDRRCVETSFSNLYDTDCPHRSGGERRGRCSYSCRPG